MLTYAGVCWRMLTAAPPPRGGCAAASPPPPLLDSRRLETLASSSPRDGIRLQIPIPLAGDSKYRYIIRLLDHKTPNTDTACRWPVPCPPPLSLALSLSLTLDARARAYTHTHTHTHTHFLLRVLLSELVSSHETATPAYVSIRQHTSAYVSIRQLKMCRRIRLLHA
jgi:hypothetical protein